MVHRSRSVQLATRAIVSLVLPVILSALQAQENSYDPHKVMIAKSHFQKGMKLLEDGSNKEAESELLEAVKFFPNFADAHIQLGNLSMRRKDFTEGLERYLRARDALSQLQGMTQSQDMERQKRIQESLDVLRERVQMLRRSQQPGAEGRIEQNLAQIERLEQEQKKGASLEGLPFPAELHFLIGNARMNLERFDEAIKDYQQALALRPKYGEVHNNLAVIYLYRKEYARAWDHLHAAENAGIRINPQFREELSALAPEPPPATRP